METHVIMAMVMGAGVSIALFTDLADLKGGVIPDKLTYPLIVFGLVSHAVLSLTTGSWGPLLSSVAGGGIGLGIGFLVYLFGGFGGGDVKLLAAIGALIPNPPSPLAGTSALFSPLLSSYPISAIVVLMNGLVLAVPFVLGFVLYYFARGEGITTKEVPISSLEGGEIPAQTIYESDNSVEIGKGATNKDGKIYADPSDPQGLDQENVELLQSQAEKGEIPSFLEVRRTFPFAPVIAAGSYSLILFGNLYLKLLTAVL